MNLDFLDVLSQPVSKTVGTTGTTGTVSIDAGFRVPGDIPASGNNRNKMTIPVEEDSKVFPVFSSCSETMGTQKLNVHAGVPAVPSVPSENEQVCNANKLDAAKYDETCWFVGGKRVTAFPQCPACRSYYLVPENGSDTFECVSCKLSGITVAVARNYNDDYRESIQ
jgi:hypothetical protein